MAIINTYPTATPKGADLLIGTQVKDDTVQENSTKSFTVDALGSYIVTSTGCITGSGTLRQIPMFTPNGQAIGDSIMFTKLNGTEIQVGVSAGPTQTTLGAGFVSTGGLGADTVTATNINGGNTGNVILSGGVIIGNEATDILQITSTVSDYTGSSSTSAGQVLASTATGQLLWSNINAVSEIKTAQATVTNAQIQTLGTVPVEMLPAVTDHIYEVLGISVTMSNSGGLGYEYDWSACGDGVFYGQGFLSTQHRVEIPNANLPGAGPLTRETYIATPIAGTFREGSSLILSTTLGVDPTIPIGQTPSTTWKINITYRLIQAV